jgi:hypothetical protein
MASRAAAGAGLNVKNSDESIPVSEKLDCCGCVNEISVHAVETSKIKAAFPHTALSTFCAQHSG